MRLMYVISFLSALILLLSTSCRVQKTPMDHGEYLNQRRALIEADHNLFFDKGIVLSDQEEILQTRLDKLQDEMLAEYKANHFFPPARNFYGSKSHIESTPLFSLLQKMPKGGALHVHMEAMGDARWIAQKAASIPEMYVFWSDSNDQYVRGELQAFDDRTVPRGFERCKDLNNSNPDYIDDLVGLLTLNQEMDLDSVDIWDHFQRMFQKLDGFVLYKPIFYDYIVHSLELMDADNVQHVDIRMRFVNRMYDLNHEEGSFPIGDMIEIFDRVLDHMHLNNPDFSFKFIHTNLRFRNNSTIWNDMLYTFEQRKKYPQWLRGYDLVAEEDEGHTTLYHAKQFLQLDSLEKAEGVALPLYLHDGESDWVSVENLYDAILLGTRRIGHGFNLFRFPGLIEIVKKQDICIEISPLSNQVLGYIRDLRIHPASSYLRRGVNCTISSDDPLIFDYTGLTYDYWSIFLAWELDLSAIKKLSKNGILYAALTDSEREVALRAWEKKWKEFVNIGLKELMTSPN